MYEVCNEGQHRMNTECDKICRQGVKFIGGGLGFIMVGNKKVESDEDTGEGGMVFTVSDVTCSRK